MNSAAQLHLFADLLLKSALVLAILATRLWRGARRAAVVAALAAGLMLVDLASAQAGDVEVRPVTTPTIQAAPLTNTPETETASATPVQIAIECTLIKIDQGKFDLKTLDQFGTADPPTVSVGTGGADGRWLGRLDVPAVLHTLAQKPGYELLTPAITVLAGKRAIVSAAKELRYPKSYSDTGVAQDFTTRNTGLELATTATVAADGHTIRLQLNPRMTEFDGFIENTTGSKRFEPVFSTREIATKVVLEDGATLVMGGLDMADDPTTTDVQKTDSLGKNFTGIHFNPKKRMLLVIMTAKIMRQGGGTAQVREVEVRPATAPTIPAAQFVITAETAPATPVQVELAAKYIEIDQGEFEFKTLYQLGAANPPVANPPAASASTIVAYVNQLDGSAVRDALNQGPGGELLSSPTVIVASGNPADITVAQELHYPQSYSDSGKPQDFTTRNVGVELFATPTVAADGHTINLHLNPRKTEFDGYVEYGTGFYEPIFSTQEMDTEVSMEDGTTMVMGGLTRSEEQMTGMARHGMEKHITGAPSVPTKTVKRMLLVFITARIVKPDETTKQ